MFACGEGVCFGYYFVCCLEEGRGRRGDIVVHLSSSLPWLSPKQFSTIGSETKIN